MRDELGVSHPQNSLLTRLVDLFTRLVDLFTPVGGMVSNYAS